METVQLDALVAAEAERYADARLATTLEPVQVRGDRQLLVRLVRNLVDNARRHAVHEVRVQLTAAADGAVLRVWNDGAPIAAADRERIFDPFTRLDEARARDDGGAGLGLSIARRICALHDGTLALDTGAPEPADNGVAFVVRLPRLP
jgi:signal transduction histidine kinase